MDYKVYVKVPASALTAKLNSLTRKGYEVEYAAENEPDVHQEQTFGVEAYKKVCMCSDNSKEQQARIVELEDRVRELEAKLEESKKALEILKIVYTDYRPRA